MMPAYFVLFFFALFGATMLFQGHASEVGRHASTAEPFARVMMAAHEAGKWHVTRAPTVLSNRALSETQLQALRVDMSRQGAIVVGAENIAERGIRVFITDPADDANYPSAAWRQVTTVMDPEVVNINARAVAAALMDYSQTSVNAGVIVGTGANRVLRSANARIMVRVGDEARANVDRIRIPIEVTDATDGWVAITSLVPIP